MKEEMGLEEDRGDEDWKIMGGNVAAGVVELEEM